MLPPSPPTPPDPDIPGGDHTTPDRAIREFVLGADEDCAQIARGHPVRRAPMSGDLNHEALTPLKSAPSSAESGEDTAERTMRLVEAARVPVA